MYIVVMADSVHPYGSFWLDVVDKTVKATAVSIGGYWAYWNHFKKRTFAERLQPSITVKKLDGTEIAIVHMSACNIGNSLILLGESAICNVSFLNDELLPVKDLDAYSVFCDEESLEPGEKIEEALMIPLSVPPETVIMSVEVLIDARSKRLFRKTKEYRWRTTSVLNLREEKFDGASSQNRQ